MTRHVIQELPTFCFLACMESFLAENLRPVTQREILARIPDICGAHENDLGGFSGEFWPQVEKEFGLKVSLVEKIENGMPQTKSVFIKCKWHGRLDQVHWVRLLAANDECVLLMNPACVECPEKKAVSEFRSWILAAYLVELLPEIH